MSVVQYIPLSDIGFNPDNPRETITTDDLEDIKSVQDMNIALVARPYSKYDVGDVPEDKALVLIDGNRRLTRLLEIAPEAQLPIGEKINILPVTREEAYYIMLKTFFKKEQLSVKEECQLVLKAQKANPDLSQRKLASKLGLTRGKLRYLLHITEQPEETQEEFYSGKKSVRSIFSKDDEVGNVAQLDISIDEKTKASSLAGKLVQAGVVRETIAIEGPEEKPITKPPKFLCPTQFFDKLQESFPDEQFLDVKMVGAFTGFNIESGNEETSTRIIDLMQLLNQEAKQEAQFEKSKASEEHRTTRFTHDQFAAIEIEPEFEDEIHSYQTIGEEESIVWKSFKSKMDALKWLLDHKGEFPLTRWQLEKYTDLSQDEIQKLVEDSIQQEAEERVKEKPKGPVKEAWTFVSKQEYDSLLPSIKALITVEEPVPEAEQRNGCSIQLFFSSWEDESTMSRWLKPSREHLEAILQFPASTFMSTNLKDILIDDKDLKKHFPNVHQELKQLQNLCKNIKSISLRTMEEITKSAKRLEVFMREVDLDLQHLKRTRRISGSEEQHLKICQQCLQPKWMIPKRNLCGNCVTTNNKQNKKAATSSGGQQ